MLPSAVCFSTQRCETRRYAATSFTVQSPPTSGPADGPWSWNDGNNGESPRPVGVAISPIDGALYISSDASGMVYRLGIQH